MSSAHRGAGNPRGGGGVQFKALEYAVALPVVCIKARYRIPVLLRSHPSQDNVA